MENNSTCKGGHAHLRPLRCNLAVAANELARLEQTPEVAKVTAMLKATHLKALVWFWLIDKTLSANLVYRVIMR